MGKIKIIVVGKTKDDFTNAAIKEFTKRLSRFCDLEIVEVKASKFLDNIEKAKNEESQRILAKLDKNALNISLDEQGKQFSSVEFANFIGTQLNQGRHLTFIIGGAYGLNEDVKSMSQKTISLSKMTFTHQMVRVIFLEQIYRAFCINTNKSYHH
jgi:23S rRNA (pseudouridine1915-N3)-methyltransferase